MKEESVKKEGSHFIHSFIKEDLKENTEALHTRFPPEPNAFLHIGHAKAICLNFGLANYYGGLCNLRFDDTNPVKEDIKFVESIKEDIKWLGFDWQDRLYFASDYFDRYYDLAVLLIKKGLAYVCELTQQQIKEYRGTLTEAGKFSPYRDRSVEENLRLFEGMKKGEYADGEKTLRAKIDMASPNMNMRDPIMYRIMHVSHHNTGDDWCIYPTYDYAHPLGDAIEGITHSLCSLEFEDHRVLYNWYIENIGVEHFVSKPRQIEFAKLFISNTILGKRYIKKLVDEGKVSNYDDPRLYTLAGMRRRGFTPLAIRNFCEAVGMSKANSEVDMAMLEHFQREDLQLKSKVVMVVLDPVKLIITNYEKDQQELVSLPNNPKNGELGSREVPFSGEVYIERSDFMVDPIAKFFRLAPGREVRLAGAYFVTCTGYKQDDHGKIIEIYATYDPATKSGSGFSERKVKGTIHWVAYATAVPIAANLIDCMAVSDDDGGLRFNEDSLTVIQAFAEPSIKQAEVDDRFQFMRNAYFSLDSKPCGCDQREQLVFNRIVELKSNFKL